MAFNIKSGESRVISTIVKDKTIVKNVIVGTPIGSINRPGTTLDGLTDTNVDTNLIDGDVLQFVLSENKWKNVNIRSDIDSDNQLIQLQITGLDSDVSTLQTLSGATSSELIDIQNRLDTDSNSIVSLTLDVATNVATLNIFQGIVQGFDSDIGVFDAKVIVVESRVDSNENVLDDYIINNDSNITALEASINTNASDIQSLQAIDSNTALTINALQNEVDSNKILMKLFDTGLQNSIDSNQTALEVADSNIISRLDSAGLYVRAQDLALRASIDSNTVSLLSETDFRILADSALQTNIDSNSISIDLEIQNRSLADSNIQTQIDSTSTEIIQNRNAIDSNYIAAVSTQTQLDSHELQTDIDLSNINLRIDSNVSADSNEVVARLAGDVALQAAVDSASGDINTIFTLTNDIQIQIDSNENQSKTVDAALQAQIDSNTIISINLQTQIDSNIGLSNTTDATLLAAIQNNDSDITSATIERIAGDSNLQLNIDSNAADIFSLQTQVDSNAVSIVAINNTLVSVQTQVDSNQTLSNTTDATLLAAIQNNDSDIAAISAAQSALYDGPKVDLFSELAAITGLTVGEYVRVVSIGATYQVVASGGDLDYSGSGGLQFDVVSEFRLSSFGDPDVSGVYPATVLLAAVAAAQAVPGGVVIVPWDARALSPWTGEFNGEAWDNYTNILDATNVTIRGERRPNYNSDDTALEGGSIILGTMGMAPANMRIENLGVDVGSAYCTAYNSGVAAEGMVFMDREVAQIPGYEGGDPTRENLHLDNITVLCQGTDSTLADQSDVHNILMENMKFFSLTNYEVRFGGASTVIKSSHGLVAHGRSSGNNKYGFLCKHHLDRPADHITVLDIEIIHYGSNVPTPGVSSEFNTNGVVLEAVDDTLSNVIVSGIRCISVHNAVTFFSDTGYTIKDCTVTDVVSFGANGYDVLYKNGILDNIQIHNINGTGSRRGVYANADVTMTNCGVHASTIKDAAFYSYANLGGDNFILSGCQSFGAGAGHIYQSGGSTKVVGRFTTDGVGTLLADVGGTITGLADGTGALFEPGPNVVVNGDCESTDGWDDRSGSTTLTIVAGGVVGNCMNVAYASGVAGYVSQQMTVQAGKRYRVSHWFENGTGGARFFISKTAFADGFYTGGTFVSLSEVVFEKQVFEFNAESDVVFLTWQDGVGTAGNFKLDEVSITALPVSTNGSIYASGLIIPGSYTVATLPAQSAGGQIYVSDETGGATMAFSDGTDWRRVQDRAVVS